MGAMRDVMFRQAEPGDLDAIVGLLADDALGAARENASTPLDARYAEALAAIAEDANQLLAVAEADGGIVGCLQVSFIPGISRLGMWRGQIEGVRIAADLRGSGLGREMILWAIERCRERGCGLVQLTTDKSRGEAQRFYAALGFTATHEGMKLDL